MILAPLFAPCRAGSTEPILRQMSGFWCSAGISIVIDTERMLGNTDTDKPFQRDALAIRSMTGQMVIFDIGSKRFIGLFSRGELSLTGNGIEGTAKLVRSASCPGRS